MTVTGKTLAENLDDVPDLTFDQDIIRPLSNPIKPSGHIQILRGNLAPEGSVAKITGKEGLVFEGVAKVFDSEELMLSAFEKGEIQKGQVIIIRYEGPKGGPGMPEMPGGIKGLRNFGRAALPISQKVTHWPTGLAFNAPGARTANFPPSAWQS